MTERKATPLSTAVGQALLHQRVAGKWKATHVAAELGMNYRTLMRMLHGQTEIPVAVFLDVCRVVRADPAVVVAHAVSIAASVNVTPSASAAPASVSEETPADPSMSAEAPNVTRIHSIDWDAYEGAKAADNDVEADQEPGGHP